MKVLKSNTAKYNTYLYFHLAVALNPADHLQ